MVAQTEMGSEENGAAREGTSHEAVMEEMSRMSHRMRMTKEMEGGREAEDEAMSIEKAFEGKPVPTWREQLTFRALVVSLFLSVLFSFIVMKLNLTTGIVPSLNIAAGLLGYLFINAWTKALKKMGLLQHAFTRQENTVIQTCVVAAYGIATNGGIAIQLLGMSERIAQQESQADTAQNVKNLELGWMIGFLFVVSFLGLFSLVPLRKIMIIDFKLMYPSGTATAFLINGFHTPQGAKLAKKQMRTMGKFFVSSFLWGFFQWFYTAGADCGFANFPALGLKAYKNKFYFDFSSTYVGIGMICPYIVNASLLLGAILSWGIMWPLIGNKKGSWYPADIPSSSLHGLDGYKIFINIAMILGDGLYNFLKLLLRTVSPFIFRVLSIGSIRTIPVSDNGHRTRTTTAISFDDQRRTEAFLKDQIPRVVVYGGYVAIAAISTATVPHIFPQLKWYQVLVSYIFAPVLAFCNAYGTGLTDTSLSSIYGVLATFTIGAWAGASNGGVIAGLAASGVITSIVSTASDLMQDFKTGYLTLASPRSMFVSQVIGTAMGCVIGPLVFWVFFKAFNNLGLPDTEYPAPLAYVYRSIAILGVEGLSSLPKNCLTLCFVFFAATIVINLIRDLVGKKVARFIPLPMAVAIPFYLGPYFAIDMGVGSLILFVWERIDKAKASAFGPAVASGLICGDGIWALPQSILALAKVNPPICMKFLSREVNVKVDDFINAKLT
ncbi:Metal-nicotianamine transporter YSL [Cocos nucifera]|uniref:Metal-nicotianamine transporter YSL n=1 Tax=Cocos nucifera TaxID=13894 RepID=A0A8K0IPD0_COCNU|nr:Metal-nicotianamine transporter YSL [Cocos nucifera]